MPTTRRRFLRQMVGSSLLTLAEGWHDTLNAQNPATPRFDLLIKGGQVVDPAQGLSSVRDVGIAGSKVVKIAPEIPDGAARQVLNARGRIVTPGLIDIHVHVYEGVTAFGIPADPNCISKGVTTVVDAGSAGAYTFPGLRKYVIDVADTRVYALLNIAVMGLTTDSDDTPSYGELLDLRYLNPKAAIRVIENNRDAILGIKIRLDRDISGSNDLAALRLAREASDAVNLPVMVHLGNTYAPLEKILSMLKKGDVATHCFRSQPGSILDSRGRILSSVRSAVERGVHLDVGHGEGSFSFDTAEKAMSQGLLPGTISSDLHHWSVNGPAFDLATTLSKFLQLGMTLEQVVERAATNPANVFGFPSGLGSLREGAEADVAVFDMPDGNFEFVDSVGVKRVAHRKLMPVATVKSGRIYGPS